MGGRPVQSRSRLLANGPALLACALVALTLYLPASWWGLPTGSHPELIQGWGFDDETPLGSLGQVVDIVRDDPGRNVGYPRMHAFMVAAVEAPYIAIAMARGEIREVASAYPFGMANPTVTLPRMAYLARILTVMLATLLVLATFDIGRTLWDERTGVLAAAFSAVVFPMFYYGRTGNVDVPQLLFIGLAVAALVRAVVYGTTVRRAVWLGVWMGLAVATKESAVGAVAGLPFALAWVEARRSGPDREAGPWTRMARPLAWGTVATVVSWGLGSGAFTDPEWFVRHVRFLAGRVSSVGTGAVVPFETFPRTLDGHLGLAAAQGTYVLDSLGPATSLLAILGILLVVRRRGPGWLLLVPLLVYLAYMFWAVRSTQLRYLLPAAWVLAVFAGRAAALGLSERRGGTRILAGLLVAFGLGISLLRGIELTHQMLDDSRYAAEGWILDNLDPGDRLEYFGSENKLPRLPAYIEIAPATLYLGMFRAVPRDDAQAAEILAGWAERRPDAIVVIPDVGSHPGEPHNLSVPPSLFASMESEATPYTRAHLFHTPPLFPWLRTPSLDYPSVNPPVRIYVPRRP